MGKGWLKWVGYYYKDVVCVEKCVKHDSGVARLLKL